MARPLRLVLPGGYYHVLNRGVERRRIYAGPRDFREFLSICQRLRRRYGIELVAYCLMPNHYHLFLRTETGALTRYMQEVNGQYGRYFNERHRRVGPLFQGRYKAWLVDTDAYALALWAYIHRNPVEARLVRRAEDYPWSSLSAYLGREAPERVNGDLIWSQVGGNRRGRASRLLALLRSEGPHLPDPIGGVVIGDRKFVERHQRDRLPRRRVPGVARLRELQRPPREIRAVMLRRVRSLRVSGKMERKLLVYALKNATALPLRHIAELSGMRTTVAVSQTVRRLEAARAEDRRLDDLLNEVLRTSRGALQRRRGKM